MVSIFDILCYSAKNNLLLHKNGMPPGVNGPYEDQETPVRNTAHWLMIFCYLYKETGSDVFKVSADNALDFLLSKEARPMSAAFYIRSKPEKDFCNGVMGQAWVIEALVYAFETLDRKDAYELAESVFLLHNFDEKRCIWNRLNVDGSNGDFDYTFNHQLWMAASASLLKKTPIALERAEIFLNNVGCRVQLYKNHVVYHSSNILNFSIESSFGIKHLINFLTVSLFSLKNKRSLYSKSVGYHGFNLYAFKMLENSFPKNTFFKSDKFRKMKEIINSTKFMSSLLTSKYSYPYNPPGIEFAFSLQDDNLQLAEKWLIDQFNRTYCSKNRSFMSALSQDKVTSEARLYEVIRVKNLKNININIEIEI